jgi:hypothetical protein
MATFFDVLSVDNIRPDDFSDLVNGVNVKKLTEQLSS